jgi:AbrB family looped-hinge helix DNA binding protein
MTTTTTTRKGQIMIPAGIRQKHGLKSGVPLMVVERGAETVIRKADRSFFEGLADVFGTGRKLTKTLLSERKRDRERE